MANYRNCSEANFKNIVNSGVTSLCGQILNYKNTWSHTHRKTNNGVNSVDSAATSYMVAKYSTKITSKMLLTVAPPVCVAKYSTTKTTEHTQTDRQPGTLKPNSVNAVRLKKRVYDLNCVRWALCMFTKFGLDEIPEIRLKVCMCGFPGGCRV